MLGARSTTVNKHRIHFHPIPPWQHISIVPDSARPFWQQLAWTIVHRTHRISAAHDLCGKSSSQPLSKLTMAKWENYWGNVFWHSLLACSVFITFLRSLFQHDTGTRLNDIQTRLWGHPLVNTFDQIMQPCNSSYRALWHFRLGSCWPTRDDWDLKDWMRCSGSLKTRNLILYNAFRLWLSNTFFLNTDHFSFSASFNIRLGNPFQSICLLSSSMERFIIL